MAFKDWMVDYAYMIKGGIAFRRRPPKHFKGYIKEGKTPVILLAGLTLKWLFLRNIGNRISKAGHPVYIVPNLGRNLFSIDWSAKLVRELIDEQNLHNVVVVGHSKGGLIGKQLLAHHNKDGRVKAVVAIATPFSGTQLGRLIPHEAFHEMHPNSESIKNLSSQKRVNKYIHSIFPEYDNHIMHESGSYLEGATNVVMPIRGHHKVVFDKAVEGKVMDILDQLSKEKS